MTEKTFLVKMYKTCDYLLNYAGKKKCKKYKNDELLKRCDGDLKKRPDFCPLKEVKDE